MSVTKINPILPLHTIAQDKPIADGVVHSVTRVQPRVDTSESNIRKVKEELFGRFINAFDAPRAKKKKKPATMFVDITQGKPAVRKKPYQGKITPQCQSSSRYDMLDFEVHVYGPMDLLIRDLEVEFDVGFGLVHEID